MFGFACEVCWDRNCDCTYEEIQAHREKQLPERGKAEVTKTEPKVTVGDIVTTSTKEELLGGNSVDFIVENVSDGVATISEITNTGKILPSMLLKEPYIRICHSIKMPIEGKIYE